MVDVPDAPTHDNGRAALSCVLVDDHPAVLDAVSRFLESNGIAVVAALSDGAAAADEIRRLRPAVAVVDLHLPGIDGIELARRVIEENGGDTAILLYTGYGDVARLTDAVEAGVSGFLVKDAPLWRVDSSDPDGVGRRPLHRPNPGNPADQRDGGAAGRSDGRRAHVDADAGRGTRSIPPGSGVRGVERPGTVRRVGRGSDEDANNRLAVATARQPFRSQAGAGPLYIDDVTVVRELDAPTGSCWKRRSGRC